jgi:hypothetical protein
MTLAQRLLEWLVEHTDLIDQRMIVLNIYLGFPNKEHQMTRRLLTVKDEMAFDIINGAVPELLKGLSNVQVSDIGQNEEGRTTLVADLSEELERTLDTLNDLAEVTGGEAEVVLGEVVE